MTLVFSIVFFFLSIATSDFFSFIDTMNSSISLWNSSGLKWIFSDVIFIVSLASGSFFLENKFLRLGVSLAFISSLTSGFSISSFGCFISSSFFLIWVLLIYSPELMFFFYLMNIILLILSQYEFYDYSIIYNLSQTDLKFQFLLQ